MGVRERAVGALTDVAHNYAGALSEESLFAFGRDAVAALEAAGLVVVDHHVLLADAVEAEEAGDGAVRATAGEGAVRSSAGGPVGSDPEQGDHAALSDGTVLRDLTAGELGLTRGSGDDSARWSPTELAPGEPIPVPGDRLDRNGFVWRQEPAGCWHMVTVIESEGPCSASCGSTLATVAAYHGELVEVSPS